MKKPSDNRGAERIRKMFPGRGGQKQVADATGYSTGAVSRWFTGDRSPDSKQRAKLEDLYGIGWRLWDEGLPVVSSRERQVRIASR